MSRPFTIPSAVRIERAPIFRGEIGDAVVVEPGTHVNLASQRAIYAVSDGSEEPAVCVELGDVLWRFVMDSPEAAREWARKITLAARA